MQASPERYGIRPAAPSTSEGRVHPGPRAASGILATDRSTAAPGIQRKFRQFAKTCGRSCACAQIFLTFEDR